MELTHDNHNKHLAPCRNCGSHPVVTNTTSKLYPFVLTHDNNQCPYGYETHQKTEHECIDDWHTHQQNVLPRREEV